jgi:pyridoxamine 5'-phosphate oxidase family protein
MSVFTPAEIAYLQRQTMGRLATVGPDGQPHEIPLTFHYNAELDTIDLGGIDFGAGKKWRDARANPRITILVDDAAPGAAHAIEIRGDAEPHETGGGAINPRFPSFAPQFIRLLPRRVISWGLDEPGFHPNARTVR